MPTSIQRRARGQCGIGSPTTLRVSGRITADGYDVELAIPFTSLRFPPGGGVQSWGIGFARVQPRRDRLELASEPYDRNRNCSVCQLSTIAGFAGVTPGRHLELDPTLTVQQVARREEVPDGRLETEEIDVEPGLTATWGVTPDIITIAKAMGNGQPLGAVVALERMHLGLDPQQGFAQGGHELDGVGVAPGFLVGQRREVLDPGPQQIALGGRGGEGHGIPGAQ